MFTKKLLGKGIAARSITPLFILGIITIVFILSGGCTDMYSYGNSTTSSSGSWGCAPGYYKYSNSSGHCCPYGSQYYYDNLCHECPEGFGKTNSSGEYCCQTGYPYYYDGNCWNQPAGSGTTGSGTTRSSTTGSGITVVTTTSSGCSPGYYKTSTSSGHCCRQEYPYYYEGLCHECSEGYLKYTSSSGHCCREGYPYYYNDFCQECPKGYAKYSSSSGHCCPGGYPYYYDGNCWNQPAGSGTTGGGAMGAGATGGSTTGSGTSGGEGGPLIVRGGGCPSGTYYSQGVCWKTSTGGGTTGGGTSGGGTTTTTYYASCSQCQGYYSTYSYRGPSYATCNNYYWTCVEAGCGKILDNCR
ncbi:MAG: hypothetical protein Q7U51_09440 [Methanoregula sp.]|nr:hypothetical protein [Methanoregula sp.]